MKIVFRQIYFHYDTHWPDASPLTEHFIKLQSSIKFCANALNEAVTRLRSGAVSLNKQSSCLHTAPNA